MAEEPETQEQIDLDFLPTQPAVTAAMRKRLARAWAHAELTKDEECSEQESA